MKAARPDPNQLNLELEFPGICMACGLQRTEVGHIIKWIGRYCACFARPHGTSVQRVNDANPTNPELEKLFHDFRKSQSNPGTEE
ncbi:MAG: hypothetical protein NVSMB70_01030 [Chamaesiphon sp.]